MVYLFESKIILCPRNCIWKNPNTLLCIYFFFFFLVLVPIPIPHFDTDIKPIHIAILTLHNHVNAPKVMLQWNKKVEISTTLYFCKRSEDMLILYCNYLPIEKWSGYAYHPDGQTPMMRLLRHIILKHETLLFNSWEIVYYPEDENINCMLLCSFAGDKHVCFFQDQVVTSRVLIHHLHHWKPTPWLHCYPVHRYVRAPVEPARWVYDNPEVDPGPGNSIFLPCSIQILFWSVQLEGQELLLWWVGYHQQQTGLPWHTL